MSLTLICIYFLRPYILSLPIHSMLSIIYVLLFLSFYGISTAIYLRLLTCFLPLEEGTYCMSHRQFTLWKHHAVVGELGRSALKIFFPVFFKNIFYNLFGTSIGKNVTISGDLTDPMLVTIGDYVVLGQGCVVTCHAMVCDTFILKKIDISKGCTVGGHALVLPGVKIGENSIVAPGAVVTMDTEIPPNEFWGGVPAKKIKDIEKSDVLS